MKRTSRNRNPYESYWWSEQSSDPDWRKGWFGNLLMFIFVAFLIAVALGLPSFRLFEYITPVRTERRMDPTPYEFTVEPFTVEPFTVEPSSTVIISESP